MGVTTMGITIGRRLMPLSTAEFPSMAWNQMGR